jgi:hypothetical protein
MYAPYRQQISHVVRLLWLTFDLVTRNSRRNIYWSLLVTRQINCDRKCCVQILYDKTIVNHKVKGPWVVQLFLVIGNRFDIQYQCDLDLWPLDPKIKRGHLLANINWAKNFDGQRLWLVKLLIENRFYLQGQYDHDLWPLTQNQRWRCIVFLALLVIKIWIVEQNWHGTLAFDLAVGKFRKLFNLLNV